jgi:hypothetical protein
MLQISKQASQKVRKKAGESRNRQFPVIYCSVHSLMIVFLDHDDIYL